jgi:hypothetical protein
MTLRPVRITIVAVELQLVVLILSFFCILNYTTCQASVLYYIAICGLSGYTVLFHIIS